MTVVVALVAVVVASEVVVVVVGSVVVVVVVLVVVVAVSDISSVREAVAEVVAADVAVPVLTVVSFALLSEPEQAVIPTQAISDSKSSLIFTPFSSF